MKLEDLKVYSLAMEIGNKCWSIVTCWNHFEKDTTGKQLVRSADSIAANISEGYGRFFDKQRRYFNFIARGSLFETKTWLDKAFQREQISIEEYGLLKKEINELCKMLNSFIKNSNTTTIIKEPFETYKNTEINEEGQFEIDENEMANIDDIPYAI